ncbi:hypothetical protein YT1_4305 [Rhodococcus ruber]|nr:hypothetical protein YT1_4305 [Rhodococcus ruber]
MSPVRVACCGSNGESLGPAGGCEVCHFRTPAMTWLIFRLEAASTCGFGAARHRDVRPPGCGTAPADERCPEMGRCAAG